MFQGSARTGYLKVMNLDPDVKKELYKHISMDICTSITGQIILDIISSPPELDEFGRNYQHSLENSKNILKENFKRKIEKMKDVGLFKNVYHPDAGFSLFLEINNNFNKSFTSSKNFSRNLFEETGFRTTPGSEFGNFPNHVSINFSNNYPSDNDIELMKKFNTKLESNFTFTGVKLNSENFTAS